MTAFLIRINGRWIEIPGVQSGVGITPKRASSVLTALDGGDHTQYAPKVMRSWQLSLPPWTGPHVAALLGLVTSGKAEDPMLLDVAMARVNMLDPAVTTGPKEYPLVDVAGVPLRSVTLGPAATEVVDVPATATSVASPGDVAVFDDGQTLYSNTADYGTRTYMKFAVPPTPANRVLTGVELVVSTAAAGTPTATVSSVSNAWSEPIIDGFLAPPAQGAVSGSATTPGRITIALAGAVTYAGAPLSLALSSPTRVEYSRRTDPDVTKRPLLRLTYQVVADDHQVTHPVRGGVEHHLSMVTTVPAGGPVFTYDHGTGPTTVYAPPGPGPRPMSVAFTPDDDTNVHVRVPATTAGLVSGLRLTEGSYDIDTWADGMSMPCPVWIPDADQQLHRVLAGEHGRSNYTLTISEQAPW